MPDHVCAGASCVVCDPVGRPVDCFDRARLAALDASRTARALADDTEAIDALMAYLSAVRPRAIVEAIFPGAHPDYLDEKTALLIDGAHVLWAHLDTGRRARWIAQALAHREAGR